MSVHARRASCWYPVSDEWLGTSDADAPAYIDIDEIRDESIGENRTQSAYLTWVLANDPSVFTLLNGNNPSREDHGAVLRFIDNGIRVGQTDGTGIGNEVDGVQKGFPIRTVNEYAGAVNHPEAYRRIYRSGTTCRGFWFCGYNEG